MLSGDHCTVAVYAIGALTATAPTSRCHVRLPRTRALSALRSAWASIVVMRSTGYLRGAAAELDRERAAKCSFAPRSYLCCDVLYTALDLPPSLREAGFENTANGVINTCIRHAYNLYVVHTEQLKCLLFLTAMTMLCCALDRLRERCIAVLRVAKLHHRRMAKGKEVPLPPKQIGDKEERPAASTVHTCEIGARVAFLQGGVEIQMGVVGEPGRRASCLRRRN